ncbi:MAG: nitroreductase family protein [Eubacteriales bacterium]|nr:nitroreductase family protein [Eubacteriales bacterium]
MNTLEALYSRRSIRKYTGESITDAQLQEILKAAYAAPVGKAMYETLNLTVITNKDYMARWEAYMREVMENPDLRPFFGAPTMILVSSKFPTAPANNTNYSNAAIVVHNMILAAVEMGLGACHIWGAVRVLNGNEELVKELDLPEGMSPCCALVIGQTEEKYALREIPDQHIRTVYMK